MIVGLDIGGANLKACRGSTARTKPFGLWRDPGQLVEVLSLWLADWKDVQTMAVTMTGELCDCFANRADGVRRILASVVEAFPQAAIRVYQTTGQMVTSEEALASPLSTAASNWHAIARASSRFLPDRSGLVFDLGSTTTDLVPVRKGQPAGSGRTDFGRLAAGELVYTGMTRTPLPAVARSVRIRGRRTPLAAEYFATVRDARLVTGELEGDAEDTNTSDGRPADRPHAQTRLARSVCSDPEELGPTLDELARAVLERQESLIERAIRRMGRRRPDLVRNVLLAGSGESLLDRCVARALPSAKVVKLSERLGPALSEAAGAWAVSELLADAKRPRPRTAIA